MLELRPVVAREDYAALVDIHETRLADYRRSVRELMEFDGNVRSGGRRIERRLAFEDGRPVAHALWMESINYYRPGRWLVSIVVDPAHGRRGVGAAILDRVTAAAGEAGLTELAAHVCDHDPSGPAFAIRHGFVEASREVELRIDPRTIDPAGYAPLFERLAAEGVTFATLPELRARDPEWLAKIYDLYTTLDGATPSPVTYVPPPVDTLLRTEIEPEDGVPDAFVVALQGSRWIGLSEVRRSDEGVNPLRQGLTGILPEHRGRGIAKALKLRVFAWVRANGFTCLKTWNDATNAPMLHVNEAMGFRRHAAWILFRKVFVAE